jgi:riboflavin transporter FmnP
MPFENEEDDLQKLNIIVQFVFLNLNYLYVLPLFLTFKKTL